ncbi:iron ABC transporter permease [Prauserella marina]|uniref:Iron complex transport system permease protein n=1 Tax=Prauserella marina TaxID=530584 RepID=A0A222VYF1_9PSEU|nr:iron chelate uptake ABC transporter family permease subunit [Prauserella marina]ASR38713.1 iron ABC transporter permease [Prauserella marina]PWV82056.1 iron complex transport system permease protein [Prauserella marina]SDD18451.1 iron complex transport system permease protein [Prauserella marina]
MVVTVSVRETRRSTRALALLGIVVALAVVVLLSIALGSNRLSLTEVLHALFAYDGSYSDTVVRDTRLPRTVLGIVVGMALGLAGALMQSVTRNPIADPGILGINHGAAVAIVFASAVFGVTAPGHLVWFAFVGSIVATALVYAIGGGRGANSPMRLALAGVALQAAFVGINQAMQVIDTHALDKMRFWLVGSLADRDLSTLTGLIPFFVAGVVIALLLGRSLNAIALGDDTAHGLGANPAVVRVISILAVGLLCGAATAACGPIAFVGLMVPHLVRLVAGQDERWVLGLSVLAAPVVLLGCDVLGRLLASPAELQVGIVTDVVGGLVFVFLIRRLRTVRP